MTGQIKFLYIDGCGIIMLSFSKFLHRCLDNDAVYSGGQTDCIVEGEVSKLGNSFLQTWQRTHLKLYPNRLEFYKKSDGQINRRTGVEVWTLLTLHMCTR